MNQQQGLLHFVNQEEYKTIHLFHPHINWTLHSSYWTPTPAYSYYPVYIMNGENCPPEANWNAYTNYPLECKLTPTISQLYSETGKPNLDDFHVSRGDHNKENNNRVDTNERTESIQDIRIGSTSPCSGIEQPLSDIGQSTTRIEPVDAIFEECSNCSTATCSSFHSSPEELRNESNHQTVESVEHNAPNSTPQENGLGNVAEEEERHFYQSLYELMSRRGQPIMRLPTLGFKELDLFRLFKEVTSRGGVDYVIAKKQWKEVADALGLPSSCTDSGFRLRLHYIRYLEPYERQYFTPPPDIINSLFKYRGRKIGNLYRYQGAKYQTNRKKCSFKSSSLDIVDSKDRKERREPSCSTKRRKHMDRKSEEQQNLESKKQLNNILDISTSSKVEIDSHFKSPEIDCFMISSPNECSNRESCLGLFTKVGEGSLRRYIHRYLDKHDQEISNIPRQNLIHMVEEHFQSIRLSPSEETEKLLEFLQIVSSDNKSSRDTC